MSLAMSIGGMREINSIGCQTFTSIDTNDRGEEVDYFHYIFISNIAGNGEEMTFRPITNDRQIRVGSELIIEKGLLAALEKKVDGLYLTLHASKEDCIKNLKKPLFQTESQTIPLTNLISCNFLDDENYLKIALNFGDFLSWCDQHEQDIQTAKSTTNFTQQIEQNFQNNRNDRRVKKDNCSIL